MLTSEILQTFINELNLVKNIGDINDLKVKYLGRNGILNKEFKTFKNLDIKEKYAKGLLLNNIKNDMLKHFDNHYENFNKKKIDINYDVTLPGFGYQIGSRHIITSTLNNIEKFFIKFGFDVKNGCEIDNIFNNFEALNMPADHPSRNLQETFYISNKKLLRTHTSNMQVHIMKKKKPPLKIISYGKVYRRDYDASHTPMFHQLEGFIIDKNISISNLKYILYNFLKFFFNNNVKINFRSSYFPFTEPSMEIDIQCINCLGKKCTLCKYTGWIEVLGCGMIHPNVLSKCNIDNNLYKGLAFGMGIERLSMIKHKIPDIRLYFENNIEFLKQF